MPKANGVNEIAKVGALDNAPSVEIVSHHWRQGSRIKADPTQGYQVLRSLYAQHGAIRPADVVEAARSVDSVIHDEFEWDDATAAATHRVEQARLLLRSAVVVYRRPDQSVTPPVRAFVKLVPSADDPALDEISDDAVQPYVYLPVRTVMDEPTLRDRQKRQAYRELVSWRQRYKDIADFAAVFEQIDRLAAQFATSA